MRHLQLTYCKSWLSHLNSNDNYLEELEKHLPWQVASGFELATRVHEEELDPAADLVHLVRCAASTPFQHTPIHSTLTSGTGSGATIS